MSERQAATMPSVASSTAGERPSTRRVVIAWAIAGLALVASMASLLVWAATPLDVVTVLTTPLAFGGVGAFLTIRVPANRIGPLMLTATVGFALLIASGAYLVGFVQLPTNDPAAIVAGLLGNLTFIPSLVLVLVGVPLLFPDGHFLTPRWRWVAVVSALVVIASQLRVLLGQQELVDVPGLQNPFYLEDLDPLFSVSSTLEVLFVIPLFALAVASLVVRYRRADGIGRHQIRWLAAASSLAVVAFVCSILAPPSLQDLVAGLAILALNTIPVAIGIAIVRYRLYDIDRLISRGISYGLVTVVLLVAYVVVVLVLQGPLGSVFGTQTVTVAISTLIVAGLFQPVRSRIQRAVDRRFDRARFDTERTAAAFSDRLRAELDIDAVVGDLAATASGAVRPASVTIWLREAS
jgi:hypothetical protein